MYVYGDEYSRGIHFYTTFHLIQLHIEYNSPDVSHSIRTSDD